MEQATKKVITRNELDAVINGIRHGRLFRLVFKRKYPYFKCGEYVTHADVTAQLGVSHPFKTELTPKGVGKTFAERRADGLLGYYDMKQKAYRECLINNILMIVYGGTKYIVQ